MPTIAQSLGLQPQGPQPKAQKWKSTKYRSAAESQDCSLYFPGCKNEIATVVLCHRPGAGMGTKASDHDAADGCAHCHDVLDGRKMLQGWNRHRILERFDEARIRTLINRIERGIIK